MILKESTGNPKRVTGAGIGASSFVGEKRLINCLPNIKKKSSKSESAIMSTPKISNFVPVEGGDSFLGNKIHLYADFLRQTQNSCLSERDPRHCLGSSSDFQDDRHDHRAPASLFVQEFPEDIPHTIFYRSPIRRTISFASI